MYLTTLPRMGPLSTAYLSPLPPPSVYRRCCRPVTAFPLHQQQLRTKSGICRAVEFSQDAPFAVAIGACMLNSLLFTTPHTDMDDSDTSDVDEDAAISTKDARTAVMTIISFIPYFNWLSWVFALMDTGKQRYAVYALVYLAPYLRTNLSLSPDDSWLPIASIVLCIIHIQLEASIASGDLVAFNFFQDAASRLGLLKSKKNRRPTSRRKNHHEDQREHDMNLPSGHQARDDITNWRVPTKPSKDLEHLNQDGDLNDTTKHDQH